MVPTWTKMDQLRHTFNPKTCVEGGLHVGGFVFDVSTGRSILCCGKKT